MLPGGCVIRQATHPSQGHMDEWMMECPRGSASWLRGKGARLRDYCEDPDHFGAPDLFAPVILAYTRREVAYIGHIEADAFARRAGRGREMMGILLGHLDAEGVAASFLYALASGGPHTFALPQDTLTRWYRRLGFRIIGRRVTGGVLMWRPRGGAYKKVRR